MYRLHSWLTEGSAMPRIASQPGGSFRPARLVIVSVAAIGIVVGCVLCGRLLWPLLSLDRQSRITLPDYARVASVPLKATQSARSAAIALIPPLGSGVRRVAPATVSLPAANVHPAEITSFSLNRNSFANASAVALSDPTDIARSAQPSDPQLVEWLVNWRQTIASRRPMNSGDRNSLEVVLAQTPLNCLALFEIGRAFQNVSQDSIATAIFYAAAIRQGDHELAAYAPGSPDARPILIAMNSAKPLLWDVVDGGNRRFLDPLYLLNVDLARWISPLDKTLSNARVHGKIGMAECLYLMGKIGQSIAIVQPIDARQLTAEQLASVAWIHGLALYGAHQYHDAFDQFSIVEATPTFKYSSQGGRMMVMTLAKEGDIAGANRALDEFIRKHHPTADQVAPILTTIAGGRIEY